MKTELSFLAPTSQYEHMLREQVGLGLRMETPQGPGQLAGSGRGGQVVNDGGSWVWGQDRTMAGMGRKILGSETESQVPPRP